MTYRPTPVGSLLDFAGTTPPAGYLACYGQAVSRTTYAALFAKIGTSYGAGDGSTTFNVPDYRGRVHVTLDNLGGSDAGRLAAANTLGGSGGAETHTLTTAELAVHSHANTASQAAHNHQPNTAGRSFVTVTTATITNLAVNGLTPSNVTRFVAATSGGAVTSSLQISADRTIVTDGSSQLNNANTTSEQPAITMTNANEGSGSAHNNMQPYILGGKAIKF